MSEDQWVQQHGFHQEYKLNQLSWLGCSLPGFIECSLFYVLKCGLTFNLKYPSLLLISFFCLMQLFQFIMRDAYIIEGTSGMGRIPFCYSKKEFLVFFRKKLKLRSSSVIRILLVPLVFSLPFSYYLRFLQTHHADPSILNTLLLHLTNSCSWQVIAYLAPLDIYHTALILSFVPVCHLTGEWVLWESRSYLDSPLYPQATSTKPGTW